MNDLQVTKEQNEVTIFTDGSTKIAQNKLANLIGVPVGSLSKHVSTRFKNVNTSKGLDESTAFDVVTYYAYESKACPQSAKDFLRLLGGGGMRAFNYTQAGYRLQATTKEPTALELAIVRVAEAKETVILLEKVASQTITISDDAILTNKSDEYYPASHVRKLNNIIKLKLKDLKVASDELGLPPKQLYGNYEAGRVNTYHKEVWIEVYPEVIL